MIGRVGRALIIHELRERTRDRWVLVITSLFALLAGSISLYGRTAGESAGAVTAPSLVTLSAFLVPLVALILGHDAIVGERERNTLGLLGTLPVGRGEILLSKYLGRLLALTLSISLGMGVAALVIGQGQARMLLSLVPSTLLLGAAFLSLGVLISTGVRRVATAASLAVVCWFLLVFVYDLALLGALIASDGALSTETVGWLVHVNPAGLYRTGLMATLSGAGALEDMGIAGVIPPTSVMVGLWLAWIAGPLALGTVLLRRPRALIR